METLQKFRKKTKSENFEQSHSAEKSERRDRFGFFTIRSIAKYSTQGEAVLRKHLRTFEENQISNIIRRTKGKRTSKFHEFYKKQRQKIPERIRISLKNHSSPTENSKKNHLSQRKTFKKQKLRKKFFENFLMVSGKSHSAKNPEES